MPLTNRTTRSTWHRKLYAGGLKTVTLLKRKDDQASGTVIPYTLFGVRRSRILRSGQPIQGEMTVTMTTIWHLPTTELARVGVDYLNGLDRIVETVQKPPRPKFQRYWQPESGDTISVQLFENWVSLACQIINPPDLNPIYK